MSAAQQTPISMQRLLWTAGVVVGASLLHWPKLSLWIPVALCAAVAWRLLATLIRWPLPNRALRLLMAFLAFSAVLMQYKTINGVTAGSALLVVMVALKFLELRTQRDQLVLMIIAYFLVFASLLYQRGAFTGLYLLAFVWVTTVGLLQLGRRGPLLPSWPTAKLAGRLLLQAVPIMVVLFILFPRLPGPLWAIPGDTSSGATGLSETMSPGDITDLGLSDEVAFRAEFLNAPPAPSDFYWRGPVLENFNGRSWTRDPGIRRRVHDTLEFIGEPTQYRVMLEPHGHRWAFALDMPESWTGRRDVAMGSDYQLRVFLGDGIESRIDYQVTSYTDYRALEPLTEAEVARFRRLPPDSNPRTRALAASWLTDNPTAEQIIARALNVFRGEEFFYTLTPPALGRHTADEFIFETREGFCEHYASAFAIMMRAAGLPARVVTGYQGGELNAIGQYYIVRQSDAHAWTEIWLADEGWVRVDPIEAVAPERIASGSSRGALARQNDGRRAFANMAWVRTAMYAWDTFNTYWNDWVIGYGPRLQRSIMEYLGLERPRWSQLIGIAVGATISLLIALSLYLAWSFRGRVHQDPAARSFARFSAKLTRLRVAPKTPNEGPVAYAERAKSALPGAAPEIERIVQSYLKARYEPDQNRRSLAELVDSVSRFKPARQ
jgi:transglutaminase-like putative cysteine protease